MDHDQNTLAPKPGADVLSFQYHGKHGSFFEIYLKNMLMTLFTLGIYSF